MIATAMLAATATAAAFLLGAAAAAAPDFSFLHNLDDRILHWAQSLGWPGEAFVRLALAAVLGGLVGLEREIRGREAGFRTNLLVALGSALVMIVSNHLARADWPHSANFNINVDPGRIAYGVMTGIGFLGAGAIVRNDGMTRGLTTAAAIWCVAAMGLAAGVGLYFIAIFTAGLILACLWLLSTVEKRLPRRQYRQVTVRATWERACIPGVIAWIEQNGIDVTDTRFTRIGDLSHVDVRMKIAFLRTAQLAAMEHRLQEEAKYELISVDQI